METTDVETAGIKCKTWPLRAECALLSRWLGPYFDGELGRCRSALVQGHVERCLSCQEKLEDLKRLRAALQQYTNTNPDPPEFEELWDRVASRLPRPAEGSQHRRWLGWMREALPSPRLAWAIAALLLLLVSTGIFWPGKEPAPVASNTVIIDSIESRHSSVMIVQPLNPGDMTVIWLFEEKAGGSPT